MSKTRPVAGIVGLDGPEVVLPGWVCHWLLKRTDLVQARIAARGEDPGIDEALNRLTRVGLIWADKGGSASSSENGTKPDEAAELVEESKVHQLLGVEEAAGLVGITGRAVRRAIADQRLPGTKIGRRWLIDRRDAEDYKAAKRAA